jgi:hypothetical protein
MSNRRTLIFLVILATGAGFGKYWAADFRSKWETQLNLHKNKYVAVVELANKVQKRRERAVYGLGDSTSQSQIQEFAAKASLGNVTAKPSGRLKNPDEGDYPLTIDFENKMHQFTRSQIGSFLFNCEVKIPRMRTKELSIRPAGETSRKVETGAERENLWRVERLILMKRSPSKKDNKR